MKLKQWDIKIQRAAESDNFSLLSMCMSLWVIFFTLFVAIYSYIDIKSSDECRVNLAFCKFISKNVTTICANILPAAKQNC